MNSLNPKYHLLLNAMMFAAYFIIFKLHLVILTLKCFGSMSSLSLISIANDYIVLFAHKSSSNCCMLNATSLSSSVHSPFASNSNTSPPVNVNFSCSLKFISL